MNNEFLFCKIFSCEGNCIPIVQVPVFKRKW